ncbi:MAG: metalloprotease [Sphingobacteriales bacterium 17-39-43]|uniref:KPN_02809 family neutral zinc metallopeptidase n=1 Tax=Daejeonella sp. TaxID=2805397 RepID=UPI000BD30D50|nr:neutral zinc metallopeptidase [Daejeonella sp.]OYZ32574.1 MAG: metalloprotease [Sphingobacteriales bacterium 16-39-50]OYZ59394.1 MAG: metalloprotease [Sphingobacteriales bacterium 24-40-4]OZA25937.1 MAG: metalloprotease [Sphingobacteriales bacterium 17-39-43]HQS04707.1 neutral zinc metallopeptidase [Daejeonella sp.]HQT21863.1 neutral zinc metallopeptidase [Daejeonella sp.]
MKWLGRRGSGNIDDRRGMSGGGMAIGGGTIILVILGLLFGGDPQSILNQVSQNQPVQEGKVGSPQDDAGKFADVVLADTDELWTEVFRENGKQYERPTMVLFDDLVASACGSASSATGPFYCPSDRQIYLDLSFQAELKNKFGAGGDFPMAYVIAHEVGHHVQNLLGVSENVQSLRNSLSEAEYNQLSVKLELQADFYAGIYANYIAKLQQNGESVLEPGDIEEALTAASAIGDDRLQQQSQGRVVPDSFTHGTSEQRMKWFKKGYESGDIKQGDTFNAKDL